MKLYQTLPTIFENTIFDAQSITRSVVPFHPLSHRNAAGIDYVIGLNVAKSTLSGAEPAILEKYEDLLKALYRDWQSDEEVVTFPGRWAKFAVVVLRQFTILISEFPAYSHELSSALCEAIKELLTCMGYEATNYRPAPYAPTQDWSEWFNGCQEERERQIGDLLYGPHNGSELVWLHRERIKAVVGLYYEVLEVYENNKPKHIRLTLPALPTCYKVPVSPPDQPRLDKLPHDDSTDFASDEHRLRKSGKPNKSALYFTRKFSRDLCDEAAEKAGIIHSEANGYGLLPSITPGMLCGFVQALLRNDFLKGEAKHVLKELAFVYNVTVNKKAEYPDKNPNGNTNLSLRAGRIQTERALADMGLMVKGTGFYHIKKG